MRTAALVLFSALAACTDFAVAPPTAPPPPIVVQELHYTTNVYTQPAVTAAAPATPSAPATGAMIGAAPATRRSDSTSDSKSVGIAACDAYFDRLESCSRQIFSRLPDSDKEMARIAASIDDARRTWNDLYFTDHTRADLAQRCVEWEKLYDDDSPECDR